MQITSSNLAFTASFSFLYTRKNGMSTCSPNSMVWLFWDFFVLVHWSIDDFLITCLCDFLKIEVSYSVKKCQVSLIQWKNLYRRWNVQHALRITQRKHLSFWQVLNPRHLAPWSDVLTTEKLGDLWQATLFTWLICHTFCILWDQQYWSLLVVIKKNVGRFFTAHTNLVSYTLVGDWFLYFLVL